MTQEQRRGRRAGAGETAPWRSAVAREAALVLALLAAGVAVGGVWAELGRALARSADSGEQRIAVDGTMALLQVGAGLVTAVVLAVLPGARPPLRLAVAVVASTAAGLLAWFVGHLTGLPLGAPGAALLWPLALTVLTALRAAASMIIRPS